MWEVTDWCAGAAPVFTQEGHLHDWGHEEVPVAFRREAVIRVRMDNVEVSKEFRKHKRNQFEPFWLPQLLQLVQLQDYDAEAA